MARNVWSSPRDGTRRPARSTASRPTCARSRTEPRRSIARLPARSGERAVAVECRICRERLVERAVPRAHEQVGPVNEQPRLPCVAGDDVFLTDGEWTAAIGEEHCGAVQDLHDAGASL